MPPPPPPPCAPGLPPPPKPAQATATTGGNTFDLLKKSTAEAEAHVPSRPKTPPPKAPEVFCDVGVKWVDTDVLYNRIIFGSRLLVLDLRPKAAFDDFHVRSALSFDWDEIASLADTEAVEAMVDGRFRQRRTFHVIVYDEESCEDSPSPMLKSFQAAIKAERLCQQPVSFVNGGFKAFNGDYPFLVKGNPQFEDYQYPSEILKGFIYLGNWECAASRAALHNLGINNVVNATDNCDMPFKDELKYCFCPLDDHPGADIQQYFGPCMKFLEEAKARNERVLIHCKMGMSRSPTLVVLWLMEKHGMTLKEGTDYVRERRPFINPNPGFLKQLGGHEVKLRGKSTIRFPDSGEPTTRTIYEWLQDDGTWLPRVVVGFAE